MKHQQREAYIEIAQGCQQLRMKICSEMEGSTQESEFYVEQQDGCSKRCNNIVAVIGLYFLWKCGVIHNNVDVYYLVLKRREKALWKQRELVFYRVVLS